MDAGEVGDFYGAATGFSLHVDANGEDQRRADDGILTSDG